MLCGSLGLFVWSRYPVQSSALYCPVSQCFNLLYSVVYDGGSHRAIVSSLLAVQSHTLGALNSRFAPVSLLVEDIPLTSSSVLVATRGSLIQHALSRNSVQAHVFFCLSGRITHLPLCPEGGFIPALLLLSLAVQSHFSFVSARGSLSV